MTAKIVPIDESVLLEVAGHWLRALTDGSREVVALADQEGRVQYLSVCGAVQQMLGYSAPDIARRSYADLLHPDDMERVVSAFREVVRESDGRLTIDYRLKHQAGHWVAVQSTAINRLDDAVVSAIVVHTRQIPLREPTLPRTQTGEQALPPPSSRTADVLTRMGGRTSFMHAVEEAIERAAGESSFGFSVLIVELERPKMLLGNYGTATVDRLLEQAAQRLTSVLGPADSYCQLDGGEFAVLLQGIDRDQLDVISERVQQTLARRYRVDDQTITTGIIVGMATSERQYAHPEHVLRDAALAASRARSPGRQGRAVFQTKMRIEDTRYMALVSALHSALQGGQLRVYYQPIVSLSTRSLAGFEALVRWQHPDRGLVLPTEFISVAEDTGLIGPLDRWVMREACQQMAQWHSRFGMDPPLHVSVNMSALHFGDQLEDHIDTVLADTGLDPQQLKLEVTESAVLESPETAVERMQRLKRMGVKLSLDDFGTGYASFSHLCQLPYDTLKIDQSFVARIGDEGENTEIINAIIVLGHNLRMDVVAEGVETPKQAAQLKTLWCEYAQGFLFSRPLDSEAAGALIASYPQW
ncbi:MAG: GGDEF and EAL domain-containing protein [Deltaproteobacteria bacterium]|nr:GGDEF and EAL domain-containing protein [Deltaproteobacteria bacterium]MBW2531025.1 GGDEF and EAL domain-containing protein [Deltaproteobacteria bacterium]